MCGRFRSLIGNCMKIVTHLNSIQRPESVWSLAAQCCSFLKARGSRVDRPLVCRDVCLQQAEGMGSPGNEAKDVYPLGTPFKAVQAWPPPPSKHVDAPAPAPAAALGLRPAPRAPGLRRGRLPECLYGAEPRPLGQEGAARPPTPSEARGRGARGR